MIHEDVKRRLEDPEVFCEGCGYYGEPAGCNLLDGPGCKAWDHAQEAAAEIARLMKAFALACRILEDFVDCPASDADADWPECSGEDGACGDVDRWECWRKYLLERADEEAICRACGCTQDHACDGGCYWVEEDLCSHCAEKGDQK